MPKQKKVLLLYTGGLEMNATILQSYFELQLLADLTIEAISAKSGADITWTDIVKAACRIAAVYEDYDGFVILHSLDNVIYSSSLVRFLFKEVGKPIIFSGASLPDDILELPGKLAEREQTVYREIGMRTNLVTSIQLATMDCSGVFVAFGSRIVRAVRAIEQAEGETHWFRSFHEDDIAKVQFGVQLGAAISPRTNEPPVFDPRFSDKVMTLPHYPTTSLPNLSEASAIVLQGYQEQLIASTINWPTDIPIIVHSKNVPFKTPPKNVIVVPNATYAALLTKTIVLVEQTSSLAEFLEAFTTNLHGEFY